MTFWFPRRRPAALLLLGLGLAACMPGKPYADRELEHQGERPQLKDAKAIAPYEGNDPYVLEAQAKLPSGLELHRHVIWRTCARNDGVCHNRKEYPELRTPAALVATFGARCNVQAGEAASVFDGCEGAGDRIRLESGANKQKTPIEIAWMKVVPGEHQKETKGWLPNAKSPGLHIGLVRPLSLERQRPWGTASFERDDASGKFVLHRYAAHWWTYEQGKVLFAQVRPYQRDSIAKLQAAGIALADPNENGIFGAQSGESVQMLEAGAPEKSYLIARVRGEMHGKKIPGSRMPLANQPLTISEMLALYCFVEGFDAEDRATNLAAPIDYRNCSYRENPGDLNLLGEGVTWKGRVQKIMEAHCGGCHGVKEPAAGLALTGEGVYARLLQASAQVKDMPLVTPGDAGKSYLYAKLIHDTEIVGAGMPIDAEGKAQKLSQAELGDILTWINNGAVEDQ